MIKNFSIIKLYTKFKKYNIIKLELMFSHKSKVIKFESNQKLNSYCYSYY